MRCNKAPVGDGALPELMTGAAGSADAVAAGDYTTMPSQSCCPRCDSLAPTVSAQALRPTISAWARVGRWHRWLPRPRA